MKGYDDKRKDHDDKMNNTQPRGPVINLIFGGPTATGTSSNSRKAYAKEVMHIVGEPPKHAKVATIIAFEYSDWMRSSFPMMILC